MTAFLLACQFSDLRYPRWLVTAATIGLMVGTAVSSSRGLGVSIAIVLAFGAVAGIFLQPFVASQRMIMRGTEGMLFLVIAGFIAAHIPVVHDGLATFSDRITNSGDSASSFSDRAFGDYTGPIQLIATTPLIGKGLGLGTNAGAALMNAQGQYLLAEGEWARVILESGPILGVSFLLLRIYLFGWLFWIGARLAKQGNVLPFLLVGSCGPLLLGGQFGQPTEEGFAVFLGGLTLAAMRYLYATPLAVDGAAPTQTATPSGLAA